jgi:GntR family transcriptional repressor for pyruvate dehydrogenase complex
MDQIQDAILLGELSLGGRLPPERELAARLGVGRSSVREALRALEALDVLTVNPGTGSESGAIVGGRGRNGLANLLSMYTVLRGVPLQDLVDIRVVLEPFDVRGAARHPELAKEQLGDVLHRMELADGPESFLELDSEFHFTLAKLSGNTIAPLLMEALRDSMKRQMLRAFNKLSDWGEEHQRLVSEHGDIAELVIAGDGESAAAAVMAHVRGFYARVLSEE